MGGARRFGDHRAMSWIVTGMAIAVAVAAVVWALRQKRRGSVAAATAPPPDAPAPPTPAPGPVEAPAVAPRAARASTTPPASPSPRAAHASPPPPATAPPARSPRPHPVLDSPADEALAWLAGLTEEVARGATLPATPPADVPATAAATFQALGRVAARLDEMTRARAHIVATERDLERARKMLPIDPAAGERRQARPDAVRRRVDPPPPRPAATGGPTASSPASACWSRSATPPVTASTRR
jgi:hypothetical protein